MNMDSTPGSGQTGKKPEVVTETEGGSDIQKEFHKLLKEDGEAVALQFLLDHYEQNPRFADKRALEISTKHSGNFHELLFASSVNTLRAELYVSFRFLSERQKTKSGGFKQFVQKFIDESLPQGEKYSYQEEKFNMKLLENTERFEADFDEWGSCIGHSSRVNYKKLVDKSIVELTKHKMIMDLLRKITEKSVPEEA